MARPATDKELPRANGYCGCGCGRRTTRAKSDYPEQGYMAGQPRRFIHGHYHAWKRANNPAWGEPARKKCWRVVTSILAESGREVSGEVMRLAFDAAFKAHRKGALLAELESVARDAIENPMVERLIAASDLAVVVKIDLTPDELSRYFEIRKRKLAAEHGG